VKHRPDSIQINPNTRTAPFRNLTTARNKEAFNITSRNIGLNRIGEDCVQNKLMLTLDHHLISLIGIIFQY